MSNFTRDFSGTLHSAERLYLDHLWQNLGVDPLDERVHQIEGRLIAAALRDISEQFRVIRKAHEMAGGR